MLKGQPSPDEELAAIDGHIIGPFPARVLSCLLGFFSGRRLRLQHLDGAPSRNYVQVPLHHFGLWSFCALFLDRSMSFLTVAATAASAARA